MRQLVGLLKTINHGKMVEFYYDILSYNTGTRIEKVPTLEEFLAVSSGIESDTPKSFDENTDRILEERALKILSERRQQRG